MVPADTKPALLNLLGFFADFGSMKQEVPRDTQSVPADSKDKVEHLAEIPFEGVCTTMKPSNFEMSK